VHVEIEDGQERIWVALSAISFDGCAKQGLTDYKLRKLVNVERFRISLKELVQEPFEGNKVYFTRIKVFEVDIH